MNSIAPQVSGRVYLVGAGPGDPGLITLRGIECLRCADVVLYDYLVNPVIARHAPSNAELICLGRHGGGARLWTQEEIHHQLLLFAREGKRVVRLKGGDPAVFARGGEEAAFLQQHGVPLEIVPGITAALAAGSHAGIPITHRDHASAVALITGHEKPDKEESSLDYHALAIFPGTLVFYMGVTTASHWSGELMKYGKSPDTPVAIVRRCSLPDQRVVHCQLTDLAAQLTPYSKMAPPVVVVVGDVASPKLALDWFSQRPLFGKRIVVTRPQQGSRALGDRLATHGAEVLYQPAITIRPVDSWDEVDCALAQLNRFDWIVFSSANGVRYFFNRLMQTGRDLRALHQNRLAAIGNMTSHALAELRLNADVMPTEYRAEALATALLEQTQPGDRLLLVRASRGRELLADELRAVGRTVTQVVVYKSEDTATPSEEISKQLAAGDIDWLTVTSSAIAKSLVAMFGSTLAHTKLVSISPVTSATLLELGWPPAAEATTYNTAGVVQAILAHENAGNR